MKRLLLIFLFVLFLLISQSYADNGFGGPKLNVESADATVSLYADKMILPTGSVSDDGNGTATVNFDGASMVYPGAGIPLSTGSAWGTSITNSSANWNTAYGWGNHASAGYLTAEVDGSTTNELPTAGTAIDVSGQQVSWDSTEVEATTWGAGGNASNIWTFNLSGTDITITFGSDLFTFSGSLTLATGKNFTLGTTQWNSGDSIDGTKVANADLGEIGVSSGVWSVENAAVIGKVITGFSSGAGALAGTDTILQAINKLDGNIGTKQATLTFGIANTNAVQINAADVADNDYAKFTASGLEGRSYAEVLSDIGAIANVVEDLTPQLGGDLDLNAHNLDFPTTANISDVKDEDDMASNSATMLATQQSIKAYADTKAPLASPTFTGTVTLPSAVYTVTWTDYFASSTVTGWTTPSGNIWYKTIGKFVFVCAIISGTSNSTATSFTLPYTCVFSTGKYLFMGENNTADCFVFGNPASSSATVSLYQGTAYNNFGVWTASGTKTIQVSFVYETS